MVKSVGGYTELLKYFRSAVRIFTKFIASTNVFPFQDLYYKTSCALKPSYASENICGVMEECVDRAGLQSFHVLLE